MVDKFYNGFWNYVETGILTPETAVKDWADLGMNLPMSFEYSPEKHSKKELIKMLDCCSTSGMKVILCDSRAHWNSLAKKGREEFKKGVVEAVSDFGEHPAVFGFHIGDEPNAKSMKDMAMAYKILKTAAPHLSPFVNFLPYWDEPSFNEWLCVEGSDGYSELLNNLIKETGIEMLCYDFYGQCAYFDIDKNTDLYFKNLNLFGKVAQRNNIPLWTTLLSVGHWGLRCPTEDDIRWQTSTAIAHGCKGLLWFFIYERKLDGSYRVPPIDLFWERTETFNWLSRQNRTLMKYYAEKLDALKLTAVRHFGKALGGTTPFKENEFELKRINRIVNMDATIIVSRFVDVKTDAITYILVNADRANPVKIEVELSSKASLHGAWLAPGQMLLMELNNEIRQ